MAVSLLAPEYILSKALSEYLAAHDSRQKFGLEEWTTTHGYFANMRGFVLRFDIAAVPTSLEATKPDELGRARFRPCITGDPPYIPQDSEEAEAKELEQCHTICKKPCRNRPDALVGQEPKVDVDNETGATIMEMSNLLTMPTSLAGRSSGEFVALSPSTLVNSTSVSPVNEKSVPSNPTSTTFIRDNNFPCPASLLSTSPQIGHDMSERIMLSPLLENHQPATSVTTSVKREKLGPHKTWKATWALNSMQMLYAYNSGIIPLPEVSAEDLNDKSKGDALVKGLAVLHITWLVIQVLARAFESLAITQLEVTVLAFSACALFTYFLLWHKPQDVKVPTYIDIPGTLSREQIIQLAARSPVATLMVNQFWLHGVAIRAMADNVFPWTPGIKVHIPYIMGEPVYLNPHFTGLGGGGAIFGAVHFVAWNFDFPTPIERLLWRISCTYLVAFPLFGTLIYVGVLHFARQEKGMTEGRMDRMLRPLGRVTIPIYLVVRLFLLVEIFRCLAYPPPSVFTDVSWPSVIPHIS